MAAVARLLNNLGRLACYQGNYERAAVLLEEGLALARDQDATTLSRVLTTLGLLAHCREEYGSAIALYKESMLLWRQLDHEMGMVECLEKMAGVADAQGQPERAVRLLGAAAALRDTIGVPLAPEAPGDPARYECIIAAVRTVLGDAAFATAWAAGQALPLEQAIAEALEETA